MKSKAWFYCMECQRAFHCDKDFSNYCIYYGCNGIKKDILQWDTVRDLNYALNYPEIPVLGVIYPSNRP